ncbi:MAG: tripartite tricarboxylate transporter substrate binding protein [Xanthobacteraceae bacterium]
MRMPGKATALATTLACALFGLLSSRAIGADDYPSRPVIIVVPFTPGASNDMLGRYEAEVLQRALHGTFVVENRPGAGSAIGIGYAAKSAPDGYTLLHAPTSLVLLPYLMKSVSYEPMADLDPIVLVGLIEFSLVVSPSLDVNSVADLIALAKAKPGALTYASPGIGTAHQLIAELFKSMTHVDIRHIPYKGAAPALLDVASGNVSMMFADLAPALPLIQGGKVKILAVTSLARNNDMPEIPTVAETVPGYEAETWQGLFARAGTPKSIVEKINAALVADLKRPETAERFKAIGIEAQWDTPEEFRAFIAAESAKWGNVVRAASIEPQ